MNSESEANGVTIRQFIALVRAKLDAEGHKDIDVQRTWIDEETPGYPFLLNVPVGSELVLPLRPLSDYVDSRDVADIQQHVDHFAKALVNVKRAERMLTKYVRDVRRAAVAEIAAARETGLDLILDGVGLKPAYAYHLTGRSWKDAAFHVLASVRVRSTSFFLQPEVSEHWVEEPADVVKELASLREEQAERQQQLAELHTLGADLEVDEMTLELLAAHGQRPETVLREVWRKQHVNIPLQELGPDASLSLVTYGGKVTGCLQTPDAIWNGEHLWLLDLEKAAGHEDLVGRSLGELVQHPLLAKRPITKVVALREAGRDLIYFDQSEKLLFDADSGRIWKEERLAA